MATSTFSLYANVIADDLVATHGMDAAQVKSGPFIDLINQLLQTLLPQLLSCVVPKPPAAAAVADRCKSVTLFENIFIRRDIIDIFGHEFFRSFGLAMMASTKKSLKAMTPEHAQAAMDESAV